MPNPERLENEWPGRRVNKHIAKHRHIVACNRHMRTDNINAVEVLVQLRERVIERALLAGGERTVARYH